MVGGSGLSDGGGCGSVGRGEAGERWLRLVCLRLLRCLHPLRLLGRLRLHVANQVGVKVCGWMRNPFLHVAVGEAGFIDEEEGHSKHKY